MIDAEPLVVSEDRRRILSLKIGDGFAARLLHCHERHPGADVLLVAAGCSLPMAAAPRLGHVLDCEAAIGLVAPFSPVLDIRPEDPMRLDRLLFALGNRGYMQIAAVEAALPGCALLRGALVSRIARTLEPGAEDDDAIVAVARAVEDCGFAVAVSGAVCLPRRAGTAMAPPDAPGWQAAETAFATGQDLDAAPLLEGRPVVLHVTHGWDGGLGKWTNEFSAADTGAASLMLRPVGTWGAFAQRLLLHLPGRPEAPLRTWTLRTPIASTALCHLEYRNILREIREDFGITQVFVSSLIGQSLDVLDTGLPTAVVMHDYYPACPSVTLSWDGVCISCETERLARCLADNPLNYLFRDRPASEWEALRRRYRELLVERGIPAIAPDRSVRDNLVHLDPAWSDVDWHVIPHGVTYPVPRPAPVTGSEPGRRLRVLVFGRISVHKGGRLLETALPRLAEFCDLTLLGCGDEENFFEGYPCVEVIRRYDWRELPQIVGRVRPDIALLLSVWPETFSYTLHELHWLGIPPLATRIGAFANRIEDGLTGFLCDPDPVSLVSMVRSLAGDPERMVRVRERIAAMPLREADDMVCDYRAILPLPPDGPRWRSGLDVPTQDTGGTQGASLPAVAMTGSVQRTFVEEIDLFERHLVERIGGSPRLRDWQRGLLRGLLGTVCGTARWFYRRSRVQRRVG